MPRKFHSYVPSKWAKTRVLFQKKQVRAYIPRTLLFSKASVYRLLKQHAFVYIKPDTGSKGRGILRAEHRSKDHAKLRLLWNNREKKYATFASLFADLKAKTGSKTYIVQRGVSLLERDGAYMDFRVFVQRNPHGVWQGCGIIGKLAKPGKIVTNVSQGATLHSYEELLKPHMTEQEIQSYVHLLYDLGISIAKKLRSAFPDIWEIGIDIGVDTHLKPWILEVNTRPEYFPLKKLENQTMYRTLKHNWTHYKNLGFKRY